MKFSGTVCILISLNLALAEVHGRNVDEPSSGKRGASDPVSNFFSELGDLFLDIDAEIAVQTAPKVRAEDRRISQILRPLQPPTTDYFKRIRENYGSLQKKLGSLIDEALFPQTVKVEPLRRSNILVTESTAVRPEVTTDHSSVEVENSLYHKHRNVAAQERVKKYMEKIAADTKRTTEFLDSLGSKAMDDFSLTFARRSGDSSEDESIPQGRIVGDILYSESRFDQYIRQLLKNQGKWILDNPLLTRWRSSDISKKNDEEETFSEPTSQANEVFIASTMADLSETEPTEVYMQATSESVTPEEFSEISNGFPSMSANFYRMGDGRMIEEEVDIVLKPESVLDLDETEDGKIGIGFNSESDPDLYETKDNKLKVEFKPESYPDIDEMEGNGVEQDVPLQDTVILAFTTDGVPLKLRMGPEIENPIKYLHGALRSAGVNLKVPVESYADLEPVGKEVLLLGTGSSIITRAVYLDISNPNELKSLLRTLMISKVSERSNY